MLHVHWRHMHAAYSVAVRQHMQDMQHAVDPSHLCCTPLAALRRWLPTFQANPPSAEKNSSWQMKMVSSSLSRDHACSLLRRACRSQLTAAAHAEALRGSAS